MKYGDLRRRLSKITFALSALPKIEFEWIPPPDEKMVAEHMLFFLRDRRVLYDPYDIEVEGHCIDSVLRIRDVLGQQGETLDVNSRLFAIIELMRASCRKFLTATQRPTQGPSWTFFTNLGQLRSEIGFYLAELCAVYGLDLPDELADSIPLMP